MSKGIWPVQLICHWRTLSNFKVARCSVLLISEHNSDTQTECTEVDEIESTETKCIQELTPVLTLWGNKKEFHIRYLDFASHSPFTAPFAKSWLPNSNFPLTHKSYQCVRLLRSSMRTIIHTDMGAHTVALQFYWTRLKTMKKYNRT